MNKWAMTDEAAFNAGMQRFVHEAGGLVRLLLIRRDDSELLRALKAGDPLAFTVARAVSEAIEQTRVVKDVRCLCCVQPKFGRREHPQAFVIWLPRLKTESVNDHTHFVVQPVCRECCAASDEDLMRRALDIMEAAMPGTAAFEEVDGEEDAHEG